MIKNSSKENTLSKKQIENIMSQKSLFDIEAIKKLDKSPSKFSNTSFLINYNEENLDYEENDEKSVIHN